jgi:hypothetical protein
LTAREYGTGSLESTLERLTDYWNIATYLELFLIQKVGELNALSHFLFLSLSLSLHLSLFFCVFVPPHLSRGLLTEPRTRLIADEVQNLQFAALALCRIFTLELDKR